MSKDDKTPITRPVTPVPWSMHPPLPKVGQVPLVGGTGEQQRKLEAILEAVHESLKESKIIRESGQETCRIALQAFERLPALESRMNRVELIAVGATLINILMLFIASCAH